jgi:hypothetical protein
MQERDRTPLRGHSRLSSPGGIEAQASKDLVPHRCFRLPSSGGLYACEFEENGRKMKIRVEGQLAFNNIFNALQATSFARMLSRDGSCAPSEIFSDWDGY